MPRVAVLTCLLATAVALTTTPRSQLRRDVTNPTKSDDVLSQSRRSVLTTLPSASILAMGASVASADTGAEVRGTQVTPFNGLAFQYRGSEFGGLKATEIDEPSVSYSEFMQRLKSGEVKFVEFLAPDGDKAYVTFLGQDGKPQQPIRIGEGKQQFLRAFLKESFFLITQILQYFTCRLSY